MRGVFGVLACGVLALFSLFVRVILRCIDRETPVLPGLDKVPVRKVLGRILGISRAGPVHQVQIDIVNTQILKRGLNALLNLVVPGVIKLSSKPDLVAGHARITNTSTDFGFVAVGQGSVDVAVAL